MYIAFFRFIFSRTTKNGRALRAEVLKLMPKGKKNATGD